MSFVYAKIEQNSKASANAIESRKAQGMIKIDESVEKCLNRNVIKLIFQFDDRSVCSQNSIKMIGLYLSDNLCANMMQYVHHFSSN